MSNREKLYNFMLLGRLAEEINTLQPQFALRSMEEWHLALLPEASYEKFYSLLRKLDANGTLYISFNDEGVGMGVRLEL